MKMKTLFWLTVFAVSMGFFESAVVIYLRQIVYPHGFAFPLQPMDNPLATTEILREAFSLLMLLSVSMLTGKSSVTKFACFIFSFAVWDIFFYLFLKILTGWPGSLMTMDILFLLPVMWVGPVIAPLILSLIMILFALLIIYFSSLHQQVHLKTRELLLLKAGSLIVIISFTADYTGFILSRHSFAGIWPSKDLLKLSAEYYPGDFHWAVFCAGVVIILTGIGLFAKRYILKTED
jgi:hypothetical protein